MPYKDPDRQREYQRVWMKSRRDSWIESQGGACVQCGSKTRLEIDHIDWRLKTMDPARLWSLRIETRTAELSNCQVLCYDCHLAKTIAGGRKPKFYGRRTTEYAEKGSL